MKEADYLAAQRLHVRPGKPLAVVGILLLLLAAVFFFISPSWDLGLGLAIIAATFFVYMPFNAKRTFRQYKALSEPTTVELREDGLYFKRETGEGLVPWSHIVKLKSNREVLLLYPASGFFYLIPSHFFESGDAFNEFVTVVEAKRGRTEQLGT